MQLDSSIIPYQSQQPQAQPVESITFMDSDLFKAAEAGDTETFNKYQGHLHCLLDGRQNTALHLHLRAVGIGGRDFSRNFLQQLLDRYPSLLLQSNDRGEIPLHIAAQYNQHEIVNFLIERAKVAPPLPHVDLEKGTFSEATVGWLRTMLRVKDEEGDTALHKAVGWSDVNLVQLLLKELDPEFSMCANKMGETPLYIAAMRSCGEDC
ncbi:hypothetical protein V6N13_064340 [Hibiscus sabdariffa]